MRTITEVRDQLLEILAHAIRRPGMYGGNASGTEMALSAILSLLCFIDERGGQLAAVREKWKQRGQSCSAGVVGAFKSRLDLQHDFIDEVASVYAWLAYRFDYLTVDNQLSVLRWRKLCKGLRTWVRGHDLRLSELSDAFGPASLQIGTTVYVYVAPGCQADWIYFDFDTRSEKYPARDYLLRDVRLPSQTFARELTYTPFGRRVLQGIVTQDS